MAASPRSASAARRWTAWCAISASKAPASNSIQAAKLPEQINLTVARKGRSFLARLIWRQANKVGLAFRMMTSDAPVSDLDERLRRSEIKKRQLQRRINELLGER